MKVRVSLTHQANGPQFKRADVDIAEVEIGYREALELFHQAKRVLGHRR